MPDVEGESTPASPAASRRPPVDPRAGAGKRRRRWWTIGLVVAILVLAATVLVIYEAESGAVTHVRVILLTSPDNVCGIAEKPFAIAGYNSTGPAATSVTFELPNLNATSCTVEHVTTATTGFSLGGVALPFSISERAEKAVTVSVTPPANSFTGNLTLVFR